LDLSTMRRARGVGIRILLIAACLTFPLWEPALMRRIDTQMSRRELAVEAERVARAGGEIVRGPSGETVRAVVYTPADTGDARSFRYETWLFRLAALTLFMQLLVSLHTPSEELAEADD